MSDLMKNTFYRQREDFLKELPSRAERFSMPDDVLEETNIPYMDDTLASHRMDIYRPANRSDQKLPVIINVHGGGLLLGCKEFNRYFCAQLSRLGYLIFSIEYRLIPDCLFFDQCDDVFHAMRRIMDLIPGYQGDSDRIYAVGDSGGACLLTYCTAMLNCPSVAAAAHITPAPLHIRALGLISGMFYTTRFDKIGLFLPKYLYGPHYKQSEFAPYINPEHPDIVCSLPPCFLVTSHNDHLRNYTIRYEKALKKHGIPHILLDFPENKKLTHAFSVFDPSLEESLLTIKSISDYFQEEANDELR